MPKTVKYLKKKKEEEEQRLNTKGLAVLGKGSPLAVEKATGHPQVSLS